MTESALPPAWDDAVSSIDLITFDCYGTLIDWETGLRDAIADVAKPAGATDSPVARVFDAYLEHEAAVEAESYRPYRRVQAEALLRVADQFGFTVNVGDTECLAESLKNWPPFPDTVAALRRLKRRYRLGILSNIDRDLFAATNRVLEVEFDVVVTAEDVCSYKPARPHFDGGLEQVGGDRSRWLHAAQSLYHDGVPTTQLGIANVWINRRGQSNTTTARPLAEFRSVAELADALGV